jgi:hypothetical protein
MKAASKISSAAQLTLEDLCNSLFDVIFQNVLFVSTAAVINAGEDDRPPSSSLNDAPLQLISQRGIPLDKYSTSLNLLTPHSLFLQRHTCLTFYL